MPSERPSPAVTAQQAVDRGVLVVNGPVFAIMLGPMALGFALGSLFHDRQLASQLGVAGFVVGWPCAWLTWSVLTPRWRAWAYERVDDLEELKRIVVSERLIWPQGHFFEKTEIVPRALRDRLNELESNRSHS